MMGAVSGPSAAASFVTPVKSNSRTTLTSTALTALHGENNPAPLLSQKGVTAITRPPLANSAVHSFDSVLFGSHGNFSALELRSPLVLPSQQHGLPSSSYSLCSSAVFPLRPVSRLTPINVDRFQHEVRQSCTRCPNLRAGFHLGFNYNTSLKSATGNMASALLNPQVVENYLQSEDQTGKVAGPFPQPPPPCPPCEPFRCHPQTGEISWTCLALLATVSTTGLQARFILCSKRKYTSLWA